MMMLTRTGVHDAAIDSGRGYARNVIPALNLGGQHVMLCRAITQHFRALWSCCKFHCTLACEPSLGPGSFRLNHFFLERVPEFPEVRRTEPGLRCSGYCIMGQGASELASLLILIKAIHLKLPVDPHDLWPGEKYCKEITKLERNP